MTTTYDSGSVQVKRAALANCPICNHDAKGNDYGDPSVKNATKIRMDAYCYACKFKWTEIYTLTNVVVDTPAKGANDEG